MRTTPFSQGYALEGSDIPDVHEGQIVAFPVPDIHHNVGGTSYNIGFGAQAGQMRNGILQGFALTKLKFFIPSPLQTLGSGLNRPGYG